MAKMDYRKRAYDAYISTVWKYDHPLTRKEYEYHRKVYRRRFRPFLPEDKDARIVDLACGAGYLLYLLQKEGYRQTEGIDISQEQVDIARGLGVENIEVGDLFQYLPRHKEEFDFISAIALIEHLKRDEVLEFLDLVYAALKPGGRVLVMTPNVYSLFGARMAFSDLTHEIGFTPRSLSQVLRVCGFENVEVYGAAIVVLTPSNAVKSLLWKLVKLLLKVYLVIEGAISYRIWRQEVILEPHIIAVARKPR